MPHFLTKDERRARLAANPASEAAILQAKQYLAEAHLTEPQFAGMVGYSGSSMSHWLRGTYHEVAGTDKNLVKAVRQFIDANPVAATESHQGRFYETENVATMRHWFAHCIGIERGRGRMVCIYAGPGGQKTFIAENLIAQWNRSQLVASSDTTEPRHRAFYVYCSQDITPSQLVVKMLRAAGLATSGLLQANLSTLRFHLRGARTLWLFDETQHLTIPCLEIVRELNDLRPYFGVMLLGSHKLRQVFEQRAAEMEQWNSRLTAAIELPGITESTATAIVQTELADVAALTPKKIQGLLRTCMVDDIYSREKRRYLSARKLFNAIEQIRDSASAAQPVAQVLQGVTHEA